VPDLAVVHSSDLHIDASRVTNEFHPLCRVVITAQDLSADVLLLAGDIFDHNRVPLALLDDVSRVLAESPLRIVILPGNHDCLSADSVYRRGGIASIPNVEVIGVDSEAFVFADLDLEVWGRAHYDYKNHSPLAVSQQRTTGRQIAMAHGHWMRGEGDRHRGWLITSEEIAATGSDYVALGHWPQATAAGDGRVPAFYCGSPDLAGTVNLVRFQDGGAPSVRRVPLLDPRRAADAPSATGDRLVRRGG
jgi:DNA repair exonuclease SbcCD nuclease subunit